MISETAVGIIFFNPSKYPRSTDKIAAMKIDGAIPINAHFAFDSLITYVAKDFEIKIKIIVTNNPIIENIMSAVVRIFLTFLYRSKA